jgi:hypothetical protein
MFCTYQLGKLCARNFVRIHSSFFGYFAKAAFFKTHRAGRLHPLKPFQVSKLGLRQIIWVKADFSRKPSQLSATGTENLTRHIYF